MKKLISTLLLIVFALSVLISSAFAESIELTKDANVGETVFWRITQQYGLVSDISIESGSLPSGLICTPSLTFSSVYISGIPYSSGTYNAVINVTMNGVTTSYDVTMNISDSGGYSPFVPIHSSAPAVVKELKITKDPSAETVDEGGTAYFVSYCDNAESIKWYIENGSSDISYEASSAIEHFPGLGVSGHDTDTLVLSTIPASLNGWYVCCHFNGSDGSEINSEKALITVNSKKLQAPGIMTQPKGGTFEVGTEATLSVKIFSENRTINYQWYSSDTNDSAAMKPISGAVTAAFVPPQSVGTVYYCVGITASRNGATSEEKISDIVAVTYEEAPAPTQSPSTAPAAQTAAPADRESTSVVSKLDEAKHGNPLVILLACFILLALFTVMLFIIKKRAGSQKKCPQCGCSITSGTLTCPKCGRKL